LAPFCDELGLSATLDNLDTIASTIDHSIALNTSLVVEVRPVCDEEINSVADIITRSFHFDRGWMAWFTPLFKLGIAEDLRHRLRANVPNSNSRNPTQQVCSIAVCSEQSHTYVVGTVEVGIRNPNDRPRRPRYAYISNLAVSREFRRRGIAQELLIECEQITIDWGYAELYLHVMADNLGGRRLYEKLGYEIVSTETVWSILPWHHPERLFLRKQIG
jgi:ribosomal protein S18 acetylase RimI-like enzyme